MDVYIAVNVLILFFAALMPILGGVLFSRNKPFDTYTRFLSSVRFKKADPTNNLLYLTLCFVVVMFVTVFRSPGNAMSTDYATYLDISNFIDINGLSSIASNNLIQIESGLAFLLGFSANLSEGMLTGFIAVTTTIALVSYFHRFRKDSPMVWFSVFSLVTFGSYYVIFNGIAQATAVAVTFLAAGYIYNKPRSILNFLKYTAIILIAASIHKTALLMIPMYFLLTYRFKKTRRGILTILIATGVTLGVFSYLDNIITFGISNLFPEYEVHLSAEISWLQAGSIIALIRPLILTVFMYINRKFIDYKNKLDIAAINAMILFFVINLLSLQTQVIQRFSYFFIPLSILIVPIVISRMKARRAKAWTVGLVLVYMVFSVASMYIMGDMQFKYIWDIQ